MKTLIAITSCHALPNRRQAIRETWLDEAPRFFDYKFFLGQPPIGSQLVAGPTDEIILPCLDDYRSLPSKTQEICRYALLNGYSHVFKCDDDVYVQPERLYNSDFAQQGDYVGRKRGPSGGFPAPYASGFGYWLSRKAMKVIADAVVTSDPAEDRWVGNTLLKAGIQCAADYRYVVTDSTRNAISHREGPRTGNSVIAACEFNPDKMRKIHEDWLHVPSEKIRTPPEALNPFNKVCIMVKTFLRDGFLLNTVEGITRTMPGAKIVIVDDGRESAFKISWYALLREQGHACVWLPFDSGFGAKANEAIKHCDREYVLIASDDFDFREGSAGSGVRKLIKVLDQDPGVSVASGRVNNKAYEAQLDVVKDVCREIKGYREDRELPGIHYHITDLTVNYSLVRRSVFDRVSWDEDVKIGGGEHGAFYLDLKSKGFQVAYVEDVNINEMRGTTDWSSQEYGKFRNRARAAGRPCLKRRGINEYHMMDGTCERT